MEGNNQVAQRVAVIMSVYKSDNSIDLGEAIQSILNQCFAEIDLFIYRDGCVPLKIDDILDMYNVNSNVFIFKNDINRGLAYALNGLIDEVVGCNKYKFIARMDSDDVSRSQRVSKQVAYLNEHTEVDVCGTSCREFGASYALQEKHLPISHDELLNFSITRCPFIHPSVMFRTTVFKDGNRYPTDTKFTEDMALWFELLRKGYKFGNLNEILIDYHLNENTIERRKGWGKALSEVRIRTSNMFALKQFSFKNVALIYSRFVFHLMPSFLVKIAYKKAR